MGLVAEEDAEVKQQYKRKGLARWVTTVDYDPGYNCKHNLALMYPGLREDGCSRSMQIMIGPTLITATNAMVNDTLERDVIASNNTVLHLVS